MKLMKNQKGFSLVELVVVMAILAILGTAIFGFFHISSKSYEQTGKETDMQYEVQLTLNQLENLIIDSTKGLDYTYDTDSTANIGIISDADIPVSANVTKKTFIITNDKEEFRIEWDKATRKVTLTKITPSAVGEPSLMAEYVEDFSVSLSRAKSQRVVELELGFINGDKRFTAANNVTMRNKVAINGNLVTEYQDAPWWKITSVQVFYNGVDYTGKWIPVNITGSAQTVDLVAKVNGINLPSNYDITWEIRDQSDSTTSFTRSGDHNANCTVSLAAGEQSNWITVTASVAVKNESDKENASGNTYIVMK